jgi:hypothetical protein
VGNREEREEDSLEGKESKTMNMNGKWKEENNGEE